MLIITLALVVVTTSIPSARAQADRTPAFEGYALTPEYKQAIAKNPVIRRAVKTRDPKILQAVRNKIKAHPKTFLDRHDDLAQIDQMVRTSEAKAPAGGNMANTRADSAEDVNHALFALTPGAPDAGDARVQTASAGTDGDRLGYAEALQLFSNFAPHQIPDRTRFRFKSIQIPANLSCSDTRAVKTAKSKAGCTACRDRDAARGGKLNLAAYDLTDVIKTTGPKTHALTFKLIGGSGPIALKCTDVAADESLPAFAEGLKGAGIDLDFARPGEASLVTPPSNAAPSSR